MEGHTNARVLREHVEKWAIASVKSVSQDGVEIADRLVIVDAKQQLKR